MRARMLVAVMLLPGCSLLYTDEKARNAAGNGAEDAGSTSGDGAVRSDAGDLDAEVSCDCTNPDECRIPVDGTCDMNGMCIVSVADDRTECAFGICESGRCVMKCLIDDTIVPNLAAKMDDACQVCRPLVARTSWSEADDGTPCANGACMDGTCAHVCWIENGPITAGALDPNNACQTCEPARSSVAYTPDDGRLCSSDGGTVCVGGTCIVGCSVDGGGYPAFAVDPNNECQVCVPPRIVTAFTALEKLPCSNGSGICHAAQTGATCETCASYTATVGPPSAIIDSPTLYCWTGTVAVACTTRMPDAPFYGQDGDLAGASNRYVTAGNIAYDEATGVMWRLDRPAGAAADFPTKNVACRNDHVAGYSDWRAPTYRELATTLDYGSTHPFPLFDPLTQELWAVGVPLPGTMVPMIVAAPGDVGRAGSEMAQIQCARASACESSPSVLTPSLVDSRTGAHWAATASDTLENVIDACLALGPGWHLASVNEVSSLIAPENQLQDIDPMLVPAGSTIWTSTFVADDSGKVWIYQDTVQTNLRTLGTRLPNATFRGLCVNQP